AALRPRLWLLLRHATAPAQGPGTLLGPLAAEVPGLLRRLLRDRQRLARHRRRLRLQTAVAAQDDRPAQRQLLRSRRHRRAPAPGGKPPDRGDDSQLPDGGAAGADRGRPRAGALAPATA